MLRQQRTSKENQLWETMQEYLEKRIIKKCKEIKENEREIIGYRNYVSLGTLPRAVLSRALIISQYAIHFEALN